MVGNVGDRPSSPLSASAKRSLRAAIDDTPERPEPGHIRRNNDGPNPSDCDTSTSLQHEDVESSRRRAMQHA
eukprot:3587283-Pleurochrysis_carterae.AAC.1